MGFNHSVKVPTHYKKTAAILKSAVEKKESLKAKIFTEQDAKIRPLLTVIKHYSDNRVEIDNAIEQTKILEDNPRLCPHLCKVLVTELLFGRQTLNGESKPVQTVREYHQRLLKAIKDNKNSAGTSSSKKGNLKPRYVRVNSNIFSVDKFLEYLATEGWRKKECTIPVTYNEFLKAVTELEENEFMIDMHISDLLIFHPTTKRHWALHGYVKEKKLMLQDKGTSLVAEMFNPPPGSTVLDMCAAPGMKTIHVCNVMKNQGTIYAIEQSKPRYQLLCDWIEKAGCKIVKPSLGDALTKDVNNCPGVEYILVDPSCSGSGQQNRFSLVEEVKDPERLRKLAGLQIKMLSHAMTAFPDVKRIAYSTCSIYEEENEQVVARALELNPGFKLLNCKKALRHNWNNTGNHDYKKVGKNVIYSRPETDLTDGIFIAFFEKRRDHADT